MSNLKFAFRQLFKSPTFTAVAVLTLAMGIGATTSLFSVIYGVLISPYPYAKPGEIWVPGLRTAGSDQRMRPYLQTEYLEMAKLPVFSQVMATRPGMMLLGGDFAPESVRVVELTANAFNFLNVRPVFGRTIQPSDIRSTGEAEPVAVLSFGRWHKLFGSDTNILGKTLRLNEQLYTIIGVMPPRFGWWTDDGLWVPMAIDSRVGRGVFPIARLSPGVAAPAAREQLHAMQLGFAKNNPNDFPKEEFTTALTNYLDMTVASGSMKQTLQVLFAAVAFLLLIACANVANLQLARATSRAREMAIRLSIGASRRQLMLQLLTESVLVSLLGGVLGLLLAFWITNLIVALLPGDMVPNESRIQVNSYVMAFCAATSVLTGILFGLAPALHLSRPVIVDSLKDEARASTATLGRRTRSLLVIAEIALAMILLIGAGLAVRSFRSLQTIDLGFRPEKVMNIDVTLPPTKYASWSARNQFAQELLDRARGLPGVEVATMGFGGLPFGAPDLACSIEGQTDTQHRRIGLQAVGADYLATLRIPIRRGHMLTEDDVKQSSQFAVINETAAKLWTGGQDPIGRRLRLDDLEQPPPNLFTPTNFSPWFTIVGIIADTRNDDLTSRTQPAVLIPFTLLAPPSRTLTIRAHGDPLALVNGLRNQMKRIDPALPVGTPRTYDEILTNAQAHPRFVSVLFSFFGTIGLLLALVGIYSVLSFAVAQRTREIGVRIALGAQRGDVLRLIIRNGAILVGTGIILGLGAGFGAARFLASEVDLFQVTSTDPISYIGVTLLLSAVAALACFVPANRASKVDPMVALRHE